MKPSKLYEALHALIGERVPLHIWGACGVGKSQIVAQVARDLGIQFLDVRAVQLDPLDLRGLPRIASDQTEWVPPKFLPTDGKGILFLDELTSAPQMTQAGCYQLVLDRKLGEYVLPDGWVEQFRSSHAHRARIPAALWQAAVELAHQHGLNAVAHPLRLDYMGLKRRLAAVAEIAEKKKSRTPGFVELVAPYAASGAECVIEFESQGGGKMRIQWKGSGAPDWGSLLRAWREAER